MSSKYKKRRGENSRKEKEKWRRIDDSRRKLLETTRILHFKTLLKRKRSVSKLYSRLKRIVKS